MIKEIFELEFTTAFFHLMAEVECGDQFKFDNQNHVDWLKKRIAIRYFAGTRFFAYYVDERPVGFIGILIDEDPEGLRCFGQKSEVLDIAILPEFRGQGYGAKLLNFAQEFSREAGVYAMFMATYAADHKVISFYGQNGFNPVATIPDVHGPGDEGMVYMRKIL